MNNMYFVLGETRLLLFKSEYSKQSKRLFVIMIFFLNNLLKPNASLINLCFIPNSSILVIQCTPYEVHYSVRRHFGIRLFLGAQRKENKQRHVSESRAKRHL